MRAALVIEPPSDQNAVAVVGRKTAHELAYFLLASKCVINSKKKT